MRSEVSDKTAEEWQEIIDQVDDIAQTLTHAVGMITEGELDIAIANLDGFDPDAIGRLTRRLEAIRGEVMDA